MVNFKNLRRMLSDSVWDWVFRLIAALSLVMAGIGFLDVRNRAECQSEYNEINNRRTRILTEVNEAERRTERYADNAMSALFLDPAVLKPVEERTSAETERIRILFLAWITALAEQQKERDEADTARAANPIPPPPSQLCR